MVGSTRFFFEYKKIEIQIKSTKILIINVDSARTPAGKIIILPKRAAKVEYATQLNQLNTFDLTLTFSEVIAPIKREINVANELATIANTIMLLDSIFFSKYKRNTSSC